MAKTTGSREFREHAFAYLRRAQRGEETVITHRGKEIARLVPSRREEIEIIPPKLVKPDERRKTLRAVFERARKRGPIMSRDQIGEMIDWLREDKA